MRVGLLLSVLISVVVGAELSAQAMSSRTVSRALPRNEMAVGFDQWKYTPEEGSPPGGDWTRWGVVLVSRASLIGQWALGGNDSLLIGDFVDIQAGFFGATGTGSTRQAATIRLPSQWGVQVGRLLPGGTQIVGRFGLAAGLSEFTYMGPFIGARVKRRGLGLESTYVGANDAEVMALLLRWYPRGAVTGFNMALRFDHEEQRGPGLYPGGDPATNRAIMLLLSIER